MMSWHHQAKIITSTRGELKLIIPRFGGLSLLEEAITLRHRVIEMRPPTAVVIGRNWRRIEFVRVSRAASQDAAATRNEASLPMASAIIVVLFSD